MKLFWTPLSVVTILIVYPVALLANDVLTPTLTNISHYHQNFKSWSNAKLIHTLDLKQVYPDTSCPIYTKVMAISPHRPIVAISSYSYERACGGTGDSKNSSITLWNLQTGQLVTTLFKGLAGEAFSFKENFEP